MPPADKGDIAVPPQRELAQPDTLAEAVRSKRRLKEQGEVKSPSEAARVNGDPRNAEGSKSDKNVDEKKRLRSKGQKRVSARDVAAKTLA